MKLLEVKISNFLSIKDKIVIPIRQYGESFTNILVGKNDSGKSNLLKALSYINSEEKSEKYRNIAHREYKNNLNRYVDLYFTMEVENMTFYRREMKSLFNFSDTFTSLIDITKVIKNVFISSTGTIMSAAYEVEIKNNQELYEYKALLDEDGNILSILKNDDDSITEEHTEFTKSSLESFLGENLKPLFNKTTPKLIKWQSNDNYLIFNDNPNLNLNNFISNINSLIPLKNMFLISGFSEAEIIPTIQNALKDSDAISDLEGTLSDEVTKYINTVWKKQNVKISVRIETSGKCTIHIEDKKNRSFDMKDKSDGFKQFISLILSISAENNIKKLSNKLILIDEPETHLYPESIMFMRDELLKIGGNNIIFTSTHSPFMIDKNCPNRHWIVEKNGIETSLNQVSEDTSMWDNKVLSAAFGLNVFKELLPKKIFIVEGTSDKKLIEQIFLATNYEHCHSIISAGGCNKVYALASTLQNEQIIPYIILDDDEEGRKTKNDLLKESKEYKDKIYTLKDILPTLPDNITAEDLLPINFVKDFFDEELGKNFTVQISSPCLAQIINQEPSIKGKSNKEKLQRLKSQLVNKFIEEIKVKKIKDETPLLFELGTIIKNLTK